MGKCLLMNISWRNSCLKTFVIFRKLDQDSLHAPHLKDKPKKTTWILELLLSFLPEVVFLMSCLVDVTYFSSKAFCLLYPHKNVQGMREDQAEETTKTAPDLCGLWKRSWEAVPEEEGCFALGRSRAQYDLVHSIPPVPPVASQQ